MISDGDTPSGGATDPVDAPSRSAASASSNGLEALTEAERRVAALVAEGHSNIEIARALGRAPATVKTHLRTMFVKLGVRSRTALAAQVHKSSRV
jgi:DNA-binding CsgD family transcriptional regulator